ncbi:MAG TPA: zinc ribbon domain-containing protein [Symbiobacteriaceae bacterium]|jgi:putative FmdB family regulatory protein
MPMYNFECRECGKRFEELAAYDRRNEMRCPACQGETRVLVSGFAVRTASGSGAVSAPAAPRFS